MAKKRKPPSVTKKKSSRVSKSKKPSIKRVSSLQRKGKIHSSKHVKSRQTKPNKPSLIQPVIPSTTGTNPTEIVNFPDRKLSLPKSGTFGMVFGTDDRRLVQNTLIYPNRAICYLKVSFGNRLFGGTGFLVGERALVTAAHCLHDDHFDHVGKATRIEVIPAAHLNAQGELIAPYGFLELGYSDCRIPDEWINNTPQQALSHDYAMIILPKTHDFGRTLGYFGLTPVGPELDATLLGFHTYYLYGYPVTNLPIGWLPGMPAWAAGPLASIQGTRANYLIDMTPGQSGGPLFYQYGSNSNGIPNVVVLAVNHYESTQTNSAVIIRPRIFERLVSWRESIS